MIFFSVLLQSFSKALIVFDFELNRGYIAKNICENRDKPQLQCKGKCYLKKQLARDEQGEDANNVKHKACEIILFMNGNTADIPVIPRPTNIEQQFPIFDEFLTTGFIAAIFHPPSQHFPAV